MERLIPSGAGSNFALNAERGLPCTLARSMQTPSGLHLRHLTFLTHIATVKHRPRAGDFHYVGNPKPATANARVCNACGARGNITFGDHVLGRPPSGGKGCAATRAMVVAQHDDLANNVGKVVARDFAPGIKDQRMEREWPSDSNLRWNVKGSSRQKADLVELERDNEQM